MEDERYDKDMWKRLEDEGRWTGFQGRYAGGRRDPALQELNRMNETAENNDVHGGVIGFESENEGPYAKAPEMDTRRAQRRIPFVWIGVVLGAVVGLAIAVQRARS